MSDRFRWMRITREGLGGTGMQPSHFDSMTRAFAERRLSRRAAVAAAVGGVAAAGFGPALAAAQDAATPGASPVAEHEDGVAFMFVQTFGAGSIGPAEGDSGLLSLTADHLAGQTLYFSDRPERIVGMVSTEQFLGAGGTDEGIDFSAGDPPNAALVLPDDRVLVVELIDPTYDPASGQVTYQLRALDDVSQVDLELESAPLTAADAEGDFKAASLFIDDCPDGVVWCNNNGGVFPIQGSAIGYCYNWGKACCAPCGAVDLTYWANQCNTVYADQCGDGSNQCSAYLAETWSC
jgi:hypothetical protein